MDEFDIIEENESLKAQVTTLQSANADLEKKVESLQGSLRWTRSKLEEVKGKAEAPEPSGSSLTEKIKAASKTLSLTDRIKAARESK